MISDMTFSDVLLLVFLVAVFVLPVIYAVIRVHWDRDLPAIPFGFDHPGGHIDRVGGSATRPGGADAERIADELSVLYLRRRDCA
ncbi:hypothetical protein GOACH_04_00750 [Gordonia aichiensis NBRC 108223]|uniref:Uncharacterized protein n=2 Tax=Gordonia aichiensis TaxID=36820 RepID=L7KGD0_9ACTN|nr:hypothetical protein GOACH_04_00750 [Gordonia aichiensis NBRC 108223]